MHRRLRFAALSIAILAGAAVIAHGDQGVAGPEFTINFGTPAPEGTPWHQQLVDLKTRVEAESNGRISMRLFPGGVLGGEVEMIQDILNGGRLHGGGFTTGAVADAANLPELSVVELPFVFESLPEADFVLDNHLYDPVFELLKKKGLIMSMWAENGWRNFGTKKSPATTPDELAKNRMRTQQNEVHQQMYKALGVSAEPLPNTEILNALKTGLVDGFDNSDLYAQAAGLTEPIKYWTYSQHIYQPAAIVWSRELWEEMPKDLQAIVLGNRIAETAKGRAMVRALASVLRQNMVDMGLTVMDLDAKQRQAFIDKTAGVQREFAAKHGRNLLDKLLAGKTAYKKK
jgi:TRAP-type C4-dicarboxylate transport system substrate-binding protein